MGPVGFSVADVISFSPVLVLVLFGLLLLLVEVSPIKIFSYKTWALLGVLLALVSMSLAFGAEDVGRIFSGVLFWDRLSEFSTYLILFGTLFVMFLLHSQVGLEGIVGEGDFYSLLLMTTAGAIAFANSAELITLFLSLEVMSMGLYCLAGSALRRRRSTEAALKYFLLGSFSSAVMLYGIALTYGLTGTTYLFEIGQIVPDLEGSLIYFAFGLMLVGLVFKIGAVPFHFWVPDVYEGSPTGVTAYMATVIKVSAVVAALRVCWISFGEILVFWSGAVWILALLTMTYGNLVAIRQRSLKRMLAYSSIAHAGYMLVAFLAPNVEFGGGAAVLYYLLVYMLMTIGAFSVVAIVADSHSNEPNSDDITRFSGLGSKQPLIAVLMSLFMLTLAGLPPGFSGLLGKFYVFNAAVKANYTGLVILGVLNSAVSAFYYLRVIVHMYFMADEKQNSEAVSAPSLPVLATCLVVICGLGCILVGLFPNAIFAFAERANLSF